EVLDVDPEYMTVKSIFGDHTIRLRRESDKPVPVGVHLYCFILPDGTNTEGHCLAVSSLIFFSTDHRQVFKMVADQFDSQQEPVAAFLKEQAIRFWELLGEDGYEGEEFTNFETGVLQYVIEFLESHAREPGQLVEVIEDFLVEQQPNARNEAA